MLVPTRNQTTFPRLAYRSLITTITNNAQVVKGNKVKERGEINARNGLKRGREVWDGDSKEVFSSSTKCRNRMV
jgi:hypothetical protein